MDLALGGIAQSARAVEALLHQVLVLWVQASSSNLGLRLIMSLEYGQGLPAVRR